MIKKILLWIAIALIMIVFVYQFMLDKEFDAHEGALTSSEKIASLNKFLYSHDKKFVTLSIMIDDKMLKEIEESMKHSPNVLFHAQDPENVDKKIRYIIRLREDSRKEFILDKKARVIKGVFKTYRQVTPQGESIINLIAINPAVLKKTNKIK